MEDQVILVDERNNEIGVAEKMTAHISGKMHRALSVFVFDASGRLLLQKRAALKYHSGGLWSNTCCSHSRPGESTASAARRRLQEEMGIDCELTEVFSFIYRAVFPNGLIEHEYDQVFFGRYDDEPRPNPEEVEDWKWVNLAQLEADIKKHPDSYSYWLTSCLDKVQIHRAFYGRGQYVWKFD